MKRLRVQTVISNNGKLVHLLPIGCKRTLCGFKMGDANKVHARITCRRCAAG